MSPAELEARGMTLPQGDKIQPHDFMDGQQKLTGKLLVELKIPLKKIKLKTL